MTRARRDQRWREQAAVLIHSSCGVPLRMINKMHGYRSARTDEYLEGRLFDVAKVRAYCERLIAEADALDQQREVFADWTRCRGLGPENREPGAFVRPLQEWCVAVSSVDEPGPWSITVDGFTTPAMWIESVGGAASDITYAWWSDLSQRLFDLPARRDGNMLFVVGRRVSVNAPTACAVDITCVGVVARSGGWPGNLAREFIAEQRKRRRCSRRDCDGGVLRGDLTANVVETLAAASNVTITGSADDDCGVACPECAAFNAARSSRAFVNGGNLRRAAQRLIDTLDGRCPWAPDADAQPSECETCGYVEIKDAEIELTEADGMTRSWTQDSKTYALKRGASAGLDVFGSGCMATAQVQARGPAGSAITIALNDHHVPHVLSKNWTSFRVPLFCQGMTRASLRIMVTRVPCSTCNGTGHNFRGILPPLPSETLRKLQPRPRTYTPADVVFTFGGRPATPSPTVVEAVRRAVNRFMETPHMMTPEALHEIEHIVRTVLRRHGSSLSVRVEPDQTNPTNVSLAFTER